VTATVEVNVTSVILKVVAVDLETISMAAAEIMSIVTLVIVVLALVTASVTSVKTMEEDLETAMETMLTVTHAIAVLALVPTSVPSVKTVEATTAIIREASQKGAHKMNPKLMTKKMRLIPDFSIQIVDPTATLVTAVTATVEVNVTSVMARVAAVDLETTMAEGVMLTVTLVIVALIHVTMGVPSVVPMRWIWNYKQQPRKLC